jgi:DNA repair protein RadC
MSNSSRSLYVRDASDFRPATTAELLVAARGALAQRFQRGRTLASPTAVKDYLQMTMAHLEHEVFALVHLDSRHRWLGYTELFRGTIDGASVWPREIVKEVLRINSSAVIACHNHPSGQCSPSQADELITGRVRDCLSLIDVRLLDHIIICHTETYSFAEHGQL